MEPTILVPDGQGLQEMIHVVKRLLGMVGLGDLGIMNYNVTAQQVA